MGGSRGREDVPAQFDALRSIPKEFLTVEVPYMLKYKS